MDTEPPNLVSSSSAATALTASCRYARTAVDETELFSLLLKRRATAFVFIYGAGAQQSSDIWTLPSLDPRQRASLTNSISDSRAVAALALYPCTQTRSSAPGNHEPNIHVSHICSRPIRPRTRAPTESKSPEATPACSVIPIATANSQWLCGVDGTHITAT